MYDIIFVSNNTSKEQELFKEFKKKYPFAKHASSYQEAKSKAFTKLFWLVWSDVIIDKNFNFKFDVPEWDYQYIHVFKNGNTFDGICLSSKEAKVSEREFKHRFFINKKEVDIVASVPKTYDIFYINSYTEYLEAINLSSQTMFWVVRPDITISNAFTFDYFIPAYDSFHRNITHVFKNSEHYDGVSLMSTLTTVSEKEFKHRFYVNKVEVDITASTPKLYDTFYIDTYEEYLTALETSSTDMFWMTSHNLKPDNSFKFDLYFSHHNTYDRNQNHAFIHRVENKDLFNGIFLCSKSTQLNKKEIEYRFPVQRKEWDVIASGPVVYDTFCLTNYNDYLEAFKTSKTELFWNVPTDITLDTNFTFSTYFSHDNLFDRKVNHVFKNGEHYDGVTLFSKYREVGKREFDYRFLVDKKEWDILASHPNPYDIVFISYNEVNADENYNKLLNLYPNAKRVHGVKGIHQAHIKAAELVSTSMFWVVDADANIIPSFKFDYQVAKHNQDTVHVWRSRNPVNGLEYGYGGVKLLPTQLTLKVDVTSTDMTMSISPKFKAMEEVSNITAFNTDPFSTWRSAFRECCKLAVINNDESNARLDVWCTASNDKNALIGALAGKKYGQENTANKAALSLINDFDWLKNQFQQTH